jgi:hypothetical protein
MSAAITLCRVSSSPGATSLHTTLHLHFLVHGTFPSDAVVGSRVDLITVDLYDDSITRLLLRREDTTPIPRPTPGGTRFVYTLHDVALPNTLPRNRMYMFSIHCAYATYVFAHAPLLIRLTQMSDTGQLKVHCEPAAPGVPTEPAIAWPGATFAHLF